MAYANTLGTDRVAVAAVVDPDLNSAGDVSTGWVNAAEFERFVAIVMAGALGTNATLDCKLEQATDGAGTDVKDIIGKAITQMTEAGTDQSDTQALINLNVEELDIANGFTHVRATLTVASASSDSAVVLLGIDPRYGPATEFDSASVTEVVY